jgi:hypothetical protein
MKNKLFFRHIIISIFTLFLLSNKAWPVNETFKNTGLQASIKLGYVIPFQTAFRDEYKQQLFIGNTSVPVSIGFASQVVLHKGLGIRVGCDLARFKAINGPIRLSLISAVVGPSFTMYFGSMDRFSATASSGLGPSWALSKGEYQEALSAISHQPVKETIVYRSICTQMGIDLQYNLKGRFAIGTYVAFHREKYDPTSRGGLGTISRANLGIYFSFIK